MREHSQGTGAQATPFPSPSLQQQATHTIHAAPHTDQPYIPHTLALTVLQGLVVASMDEDEMLRVMKRVTSDAELAGAVSYLFTAVGASAPPHVQMSIDPPDGSPKGPPD